MKEVKKRCCNGYPLSKPALLRFMYHNGIDMKVLLEKANVSSTTITRALRTNSPVFPSTAKKLADVLGVDAMELVQTEDETEKGA